LYFWILISALAVGLDILTANFFFSCFMIGGIGAMIAASLDFSVKNQIIVFTVVSGVSLMTVYPFMRKYVKKSVPKTPTTEEGYVGRVITAETDIDGKTQIKIDGIYWVVVNEGKPIMAGEKMKIIDLQGTKFTVRKEEEN